MKTLRFMSNTTLCNGGADLIKLKRLAVIMFSFVLSLMLLSPLSAQQLTSAQKIRDFEHLVTQIEAAYGPLEHKRDLLSLDVEQLRQQYLTEIEATTDNITYYYMLNQFIAEFQDSHFAGQLPTNFATILGFNTDLVEGRVWIDQINRRLLPHDLTSDRVLRFLL